MHRIRLGSAWRVSVSLSGKNSSAPDLVDLPLDGKRLTHLVDGQSMILRRSFNRPSGLASGQSIRIELDGLGPNAIVSLNDVILDSATRSPASPSTVELEITKNLRDHNVLQIEFTKLESRTVPQQPLLSMASMLIADG